MFQPRSPLAVALGGMAIMAVCMGIGRFVYTPILPFMINAEVLDRSDAGLLAGVNYLGYLLGAIAAVSNRITADRRTIMYGGILLSLATTAAMGLTENFNAFLVIRFLSGIASAFAMIFMSSIVFDLASKPGSSYLSSIQFSGVGLGIAISALTISLYPDQSANWQSLWVLAGALSAIGLLAAFIGIGSKTRTNTKSETLNEQQVRTNSEPKDDSQRTKQTNNTGANALIWLIISYGLFGFGYIITATFISELAASTPSLASTSNIEWLVVGVSGMVFTYPLSQIADKYGNLKIYAYLCFVITFGVALSVLVLHPIAILVSAALLGATFISITVMGLRSANRIVSSLKLQESRAIFGKWDERIAVALMTASFGTGQMLGPIVAGVLYEKYESLQYATLLAAVLLASCAIISLYVDRVLEKTS